jgi:serine/threonine protein kinase
MTGRVIAGRYNLQHPIGRGAMGVVWRARDQLLDRDVAVKEVVISALIGADERRNAYQRTLREARTAARLSHRGVVAVYDVAEEDGRPWIVMELVPSQSLDQVLTVEKRLPPARAGRIGQQLLSALAAAHAAGVLHRDVKPSNVLIANNRAGEGWEERAVLTDFGIAQFEGDPRLTQTGMVMGSPGFTAPERIRGSDATPASDLWSLGATIYAAVEGRGPYENRGGAITTMSAIINEDAPVAPHAGPLASVIAALLRRDPSMRPSASAAMRMFGRALPQLSEATEEPAPMAHPPTIRSAYLPVPAAPVASAPVTSPDDARRAEKPAPTVEKKPAPAAEEKPAPAAEKEPAEEAPAAETPAAEAPAEEETAREAPESPSADEADEADAAAEAALLVSTDAAGEADSAEPPAEDESEAEPEPESADDPEPVVKAEADADADAATDSADAGDKAERAAETTKFRVPVAESAEVPAPEAAAADAPGDAKAAEPKAAAAALLEARPAAEEQDSKSEETVIPGKTPGYQPTQLSVPVARISPSAPVKPPSTAQPQPAPAKPAQPKPTPPKPTFTAAKPTERAAPTFSAATPPRPATPARPTPVRPATPPPPQRPAYGAVSAGAGYPPPRWQGSATPPPPSAAHYAPPVGQYVPPSGQYVPPSGQYAGPSQPSPDLARQYMPGTGGGRKTPRRQIIWLVVAVIIAAAIGVGVALALSDPSGANNADTTSANNAPTAVPSVADTPTGFQSVDALNDPSAALPAANWSTQTVTADEAGSTAAGFSIDLPPGWTETRNGLATDFTGPGHELLEIDLTDQATTNMLTAATQVAAASHFADYKQQSLQAVPVRHAEGAVWKFSWAPTPKVQYTADDIFFAQATPAGVQDYAIYVRSPSSTFSTSLTIFDEMLRTFQTAPAS